MKKIALLALVPCALLIANPWEDLPQFASYPTSQASVDRLARATAKRLVQEQAQDWASQVEDELIGDLELLNQSGVKLSTADLARFMALVGVDCAYDGLDDLSQGDVKETVKSSLHNALLHTESRAVSAALKTAWSILNPFDLRLVNFENHLGQTVGVAANYVRNAYVDEFLNNVVKRLIANNAPWHKSNGAAHAAE